MGTLSEIGKAKASKAKAKKPGGTKPSKKDRQAAGVVKDLKGKAAAALSPEAQKSALVAIEEIKRNWDKWKDHKATQKKVGFECKQKEDADEAALKVAIEEELPAAPLAERNEKAIHKLELIEQRWQEYEETKDANTEHRKHAKEQVEFYRDKLERALSEAAQLTLPNVS